MSEREITCLQAFSGVQETQELITICMSLFGIAIRSMILPGIWSEAMECSVCYGGGNRSS
jgi:hypothetical protein